MRSWLIFMVERVFSVGEIGLSWPLGELLRQEKRGHRITIDIMISCSNLF